MRGAVWVRAGFGPRAKDQDGCAESQIEKLEDEVRNQRWQGRLVTVRLEDENLRTDDCVLVAHRWENGPSHTIGLL